MMFCFDDVARSPEFFSTQQRLKPANPFSDKTFSANHVHHQIDTTYCETAFLLTHPVNLVKDLKTVFV